MTQWRTERPSRTSRRTNTTSPPRSFWRQEMFTSYWPPRVATVAARFSVNAALSRGAGLPRSPSLRPCPRFVDKCQIFECHVSESSISANIRLLNVSTALPTAGVFATEGCQRPPLEIPCTTFTRDDSLLSRLIATFEDCRPSGSVLCMNECRWRIRSSKRRCE
jgi:hypothetical protein